MFESLIDIALGKELAPCIDFFILESRVKHGGIPCCEQYSSHEKIKRDVSYLAGINAHKIHYLLVQS